MLTLKFYTEQKQFIHSMIIINNNVLIYEKLSACTYTWKIRWKYKGGWNELALR